ncbi:MAG TPA: thiamine-phosphate kinase [Chitinivibrionales bacterium]|nr:thiamine-phosphate kinase [Chitinivibrionales bacterium]
MPGEKEIINILDAVLPQGRLNRCNESDCEIISLCGQKFLFTTDEFSEEDRFCEQDPRLLGWNIAAGALSDVYACGGTPHYYAHSLTVAKTWDGKFIEEFGRGVADALGESGARFMGGDCGQAQEWRCCVSIIGSCDGEPITRMGARPGDRIYLSGRVGAGNVQAALGMSPFGKRGVPGLPGIRFRLRARESALVKRNASSCIDTSDGVWKSLTIIADLNRCGYAVDSLPYHRAGVLLAKAVAMPAIMLFFAECGEYELLCTIPEKSERDFLREAGEKGLRFFRIGTVTENLRTIADGKNTLEVGDLHIEARGFESTREYLTALTGWIKRQRSRETESLSGGAHHAA